MSNHTKGEWKADISLTYGSQPRVGTDDKLVCCVGNGVDPVVAQEEWEANARLIAAAPDLLVACRKLVEWHGARDNHEVLLKADDQNHEIRVAMIAIAKAEGRS